MILESFEDRRRLLALEDLLFFNSLNEQFSLLAESICHVFDRPSPFEYVGGQIIDAEVLLVSTDFLDELLYFNVIAHFICVLRC